MTFGLGMRSTIERCQKVIAQDAKGLLMTRATLPKLLHSWSREWYTADADNPHARTMNEACVYMRAAAIAMVRLEEDLEFAYNIHPDDRSDFG